MCRLEHMSVIFNWPYHKMNEPYPSSRRGPLHFLCDRICGVKVSALLPVAVLALVCIVGRAQVVTVNQDFKGTTAPGWTLGDNGGGFTPVLTASTAGGSIDPVGSGWLRLTSSGGNQATYAYDTTSFNAANATVAVKFDFATYNGTGADGITFFLADASKTFGVGAYGGSLGYAQKTAAGGAPADINGMNGGYLGVGIDEYGNYSNPTEGRVGGIGSVPNGIAVRGPGQGLTGYNYLGGTGNLGANSLAFPGSTTRPTGADTRSVEIDHHRDQSDDRLYVGPVGGAYVPLYYHRPLRLRPTGPVDHGVHRQHRRLDRHSRDPECQPLQRRRQSLDQRRRRHQHVGRDGSELEWDGGARHRGRHPPGQHLCQHAPRRSTSGPERGASVPFRSTPRFPTRSTTAALSSTTTASSGLPASWSRRLTAPPRRRSIQIWLRTTPSKSGTARPARSV